MAIFILIVGCSKSENSSVVNSFVSKESALENYVKSENVDGNNYLIITTTEKPLLLSEWDDNIFFVSELKSDSERFYFEKVSASYQIESGVSWELTTIDGNEYTVFLQRGNNTSFIPLINTEYYVFLAEGHKLGEDPLTLTNAIVDFKNVGK